MSPIPKGRKPVSTLSADTQVDALVSFNFDDVRAAPSPAPAATDHVTFRTFDGQVIEFAGRRDGEKAYVSVSCAARCRARGAIPAARPAAPPAPATPAATAPATAPAASAPKPAAQTVERLGSRASGVEYEIPVYKYDSLFKPQEDLLEKPPGKK